MKFKFSERDLINMAAAFVEENYGHRVASSHFIVEALGVKHAEVSLELEDGGFLETSEDDDPDGCHCDCCDDDKEEDTTDKEEGTDKAGDKPV